MSEIKFACPHCDQHIACDDLYCGERIACPGCNGILFIPPLAASIPLHPGNVALALPVAAREKMQPHSVRADHWTEAAWEEHASAMDGRSRGSMLPFWVMLILPLFVALLFLAHRGSFTSMAVWFLICAFVAGFYLAKLQADSVVGIIVRGLMYSFGALMGYFILSLGLLFVGCLLS
jgi:hypothetical protein